LAIIRQWVCDQGLAGTDLRVLDAFGWTGEANEPESDGCSSFEELEQRSMVSEVGLEAKIAKALSGEVDAEQAAMFGRRVSGVLGFVATLRHDSSWSRVLRVALCRRVLQILDVSFPPTHKPPRALRVRAVADYYFSLAAVEHHRLKRIREGLATQTLQAVVEGAQWNSGAGYRWATLQAELEEGPFRATDLEMDPAACVVTAEHRVAACGRGEALLDSVREYGAIAAVSGGFFLYSEPDIREPGRRYDPVGLLMTGGRVLHPPCFNRVAFVQRRSGVCEVLRLGLNNLEVRGADQSIVLDGVRYGVFTRLDGVVAPSGFSQIAIEAGQVCAVSETGGLFVPLNGFVVMALLGDGLDWPVGAPVEYALPEEPDPIETAMAGGPELLVRGGIDLARDGFFGTAPPRTFSGDETGDCNLLPRMAVGVRDSGRVVFAAVDGRNFDRALGLTLKSLGDLMRLLGCSTAMNLDGGSSKRIVIDDQVRDLPTTEVVGGEFKPVGIRPVRTALFWRYLGT